MAVSFYRLGVTRQLLSYGIRKFERGQYYVTLSCVIVLLTPCIFFYLLPFISVELLLIQRLLSALVHIWLRSSGGL